MMIKFLKEYYSRSKDSSKQSGLFLTKSERVYFVNTILKLIDRGQYSKNEHLSETVATATSILSYVEPSLVLPFLASRFYMALETMTATHQLKSTVASVAFAGRSLFLASLTALPMDNGSDSFAESAVASVAFARRSLLLTSLTALPMDNGSDPYANLLMTSLSNALLGMKALIYHQLQGLTFLVKEGPYYFCMLEILLGRLSASLYMQALKKISEFVTTSILPGAIAEIGLLCSACVHSNPQDAIFQLIKPILESVTTSLEGTPKTGYRKRATSNASSSRKEKSILSPALETAIEYQLKVLSEAISNGGPALLSYREQFKEVLSSAFDSTSWKETRKITLKLLFNKLTLHYKEMRKINLKCLLQVYSSLQGVLSCLPDFRPSSENGMVKEAGASPFLIAGATGSCVGSTELREMAAGVIYETCKYLLKVKSDDSILLLLVIRIMDTLGNHGNAEYEEWYNHRQALESTVVVEPPVNFIVSSHLKGKRRPRWALTEKAYMHNTWRSSQSSYHLFRTSRNMFASKHVTVLMDDLLKLCLYSYESVRWLAAQCILKLMKRWPSTISKYGCRSMLLCWPVPSPLKSTVTKAVAEFRRTHADTCHVNKESFDEYQLEVLADASSSYSYFA
ncbi:proteasome activator subunit 4-like [Salvia splendens]|uniref:proteasome activator subunit 4-like n=1 Tax=Salvia splendens TaxID=180675 RepID=UPI001C27666E|nr:proteasome activator subunit 4-like [Salvia splendens]